MSEFHIHDGWKVERGPADEVRIWNAKQHAFLIMDAETWASVIAHVAAGGDTAENFAAALRLYHGE